MKDGQVGHLFCFTHSSKFLRPSVIKFNDVEASTSDLPREESTLRGLRSLSPMSPLVQIIHPSARRQIDGGSGALSEQEDVHGRWKHARVSAHWRPGPDSNKRSLPSVTGRCLSEHNTEAAPWQQALPASCVCRDNPGKLNLLQTVQSSATTCTFIKFLGVLIRTK